MLRVKKAGHRFLKLVVIVLLTSHESVTAPRKLPQLRRIGRLKVGVPPRLRQQGFDSQKLAEALEVCDSGTMGIHSLLIVRNGYVCWSLFLSVR